MCNRVCFFSPRKLDHPFRDQRSRDAGPEEILVLINRAGLKHWKNEIAREFLPKILNNTFRCTGFERLLFQTSEFLFLTDVRAERGDLRAIIIFQPAKNDGSVEATGIRENDFHHTKDTEDTKVT